MGLLPLWGLDGFPQGWNRCRMRFKWFQKDLQRTPMDVLRISMDIRRSSADSPLLWMVGCRMRSTGYHTASRGFYWTSLDLRRTSSDILTFRTAFVCIWMNFTNILLGLQSNSGYAWVSSIFQRFQWFSYAFLLWKCIRKPLQSLENRRHPIISQTRLQP